MKCPYKMSGSECDGANCPVYTPTMDCQKNYDVTCIKDSNGKLNIVIDEVTEDD